MEIHIIPSPCPDSSRQSQFFYCVFPFRKVKTVQQGKRFQDVKDINKNMMAELKAVPLEAFAECFQKFIK